MSSSLPGLDEEAVFPSRWATRVRRIVDPVTRDTVPYGYDRHPWVRRLIDDFSEEIAIIKGAQMGFTEAVLTKVLHANVVLRRSALYCLPDEDLAGEFSASRVNQAIEAAPDLAGVYSVDNVGHKRTGSVNLWLRGMRARGKLKLIDPSLLILDEVDEMRPRMVGLARKRVGGQMHRQTIELSTPTHPGFGVDASIKDTARYQWRVPCPRCSAMVFLDIDSLDLAQSCVVCPSCRAPWTEAQRVEAVTAGRWIPLDPRASRSGYEIRQVCSLVQTPAQLVAEYRDAEHDPGKLTEWHNAFGRAHAVEGSSLTPQLVEACMRDYLPATHGQGTTMGVDVGTRLHVRISERRPDERDPRRSGRRVLRVLEAADFEELDSLMRVYGVSVCVIDSLPETRKGREFQSRWGGPEAGRVWLAIYTEQRELARWDETRGMVTIHRTEAMDATLTRFRIPADADLPHGTIDLPRGLSDAFINQLCAPVRIYETSSDGTRRAVYREHGDDHYAHASLYDEIAALRSVEAVASQVVAPPESRRPSVLAASVPDADAPARHMPMRGRRGMFR